MNRTNRRMSDFRVHGDAIQTALESAASMAEVLREFGWRANVSTRGICTTAPEVYVYTDAPARARLAVGIVGGAE